MQDPHSSPKLPSSSEPPVWPELGAATARPASNGWHWLVDAFGFFKADIGIWIAMSLIYVILMAVISSVPLLSMIAPILAPVFSGGLMMACRRQDVEGKLVFNDLFAGFQQKAGPLSLLGLIFLGLYFLWAVIVGLMGGGAFLQMGGMHAGQDPLVTLQGLGFVVVIGLLLLVPILMAQWFAPGLVALHDVAPWAACKLSLNACFKNSVPFLVFGCVVFPAAMLATLPAMLGWLILLPVLIASVYTSYKDVFQLNNPR
ncbi:MAG: hypothetical protein IPM37_07455 [Hahellaceae bacterium]|nr:hypothetical protein [Hahellaceae bacterium]